jgi:hypothetical protein
MAFQVKYCSKDTGFTRNKANSSLFVQHKSADKLIVFVYIDNLIIIGNNEEFVAKLKNDL